MQATRLLNIVLVSFFLSATADSLNAQTIIHVPLYTFGADSAGDGFGGAVSGAGDVNGDGIPDLIVGAIGDDSGTTSGSARVFSGSDGSLLYNFDGDSAGDLFGASVSGAGDVNGDGFADLIVGAPGPLFAIPVNGYARVFSGIDGSVLFNFDGDSLLDFFGRSVSGVGDLNGDGFDDFIVGAPGTPFGNAISGYARVFSGSDGSVLYNFEGDSLFDEFGASVSGAGDIDGDGFADLIVGATGVDSDDPFIDGDSGSARVFSGSDGSVLHNFAPANPNGGEGFGTSVSGAGDVNGDGFADLIVGAHVTADGFGGIGGSARVFSGSDGSVLYLYGGGFEGFFGRSVSGAGDVNGDGFADVIIGVAGDAETGFGGVGGSARVRSGIDGSALYDFDGDFRFDGFGTSVSAAGDLNGDGIDDFIVGAYANAYIDAIEPADELGYARVFVSQFAELGDCNHDGVVSFLDIGPFITILSAGDYLYEADTNEDGVVTFLDIQHFIALLAS